MQEQKSKPPKDRHPLITIGIVTAGTQMGSALIQRMGRRPVLLFTMGVGAEIYTYKNRKVTLDETRHLKDQSISLLSTKTKSE